MSTAGTEKLGHLVTSFQRLEVEDYQRVYVWESENIQNLWDDLVACADAPKDRDHFFGTLILQTDAESERDTAKVVDGQQRLTTVFLVVAALRDAISSLSISALPPQGSVLGIDVLRNAWNFLVVNLDTAQHRFIPNRLLRKIMATSVIPEPLGRPEVPWRNKQSYEKATEITKPFRQAVRFIHALVGEDLAGLPDDLQKLTRINQLLDTLFTRFTVLKVTSSSIDESLDIFLTLNSRGRELNASDLARGEILKKLTLGISEESRIQAIHKQNLEDWDHIGQFVGDHEVFLRHFLVSTSSNQITKKMVLNEVVQRLNPKEADGLSDINRAHAFWDDFKKAGNRYGRILKADFPEPTRTHMLQLNDLIVSHRVLFLNVLNQNLQQQVLAEIVRLTWVLAYRWRLLTMNAQDLENFFRDTGRSLALNKLDAAGVISVLESKISDLPMINEKKWLTDRDGSSHARALLYMLYYLGVGKEPLKWKMSDFHLEHVAPQSRTPHWVSEALPGVEIDSVDDEDWRTLVSAAGNLTLLDPGINLKVQNDPFRTSSECPSEDKDIDNKVCWYRKSVLEMNREICDEPVWTREVIEDRSKWLAAMFENIWAVKPKYDNVISYAEWKQGA